MSAVISSVNSRGRPCRLAYALVIVCIRVSFVGGFGCVFLGSFYQSFVVGVGIIVAVVGFVGVRVSWCVSGALFGCFWELLCLVCFV